MKRPPQPIVVTLSKPEIEAALVHAVATGKFGVWTENDWRQGLLNTAKDPNVTERVGSMGEHAFSQITGLPVDTHVSLEGNKFDFLLEPDLKVDMKTQLSDPGYCYVKARSERGTLLTMKSDIYVFGLALDWNGSCATQIKIWGYVCQDFLVTCQIIDAIKGDHKNYAVEKIDLLPVQDLIEMAKPHAVII